MSISSPSLIAQTTKYVSDIMAEEQCPYMPPILHLNFRYYGGGAVPPIYIFSESYGGKVAPVFGSHIIKAQKAGRLSDVILGTKAPFLIIQRNI